MAAYRFLARLILLVAFVSTFGCSGCDVLDPLNYVDVKQFYPDLPQFDADVAQPDMGEGPGDTGRVPKDTNFEFDFGEPGDAGDSVFAISAVVPDFGPVEGGTRVRIQGTALQQGSTVFIGTHEMEVELSGGTLVGLTPPGAGPGPATVKVIAPDGEVRALVDGYRYVETLRVDSVVPFRVPTTGGVEVEVRGAGFSDVLGVSFSGDAALRVSVGFMKIGSVSPTSTSTDWATGVTDPPLMVTSAVAPAGSAFFEWLIARDIARDGVAIQGAHHDPREGHAHVRGGGIHALFESDDVLDCGNSGTTMRLLSGLLFAAAHLVHDQAESLVAHLQHDHSRQRCDCGFHAHPATQVYQR